MTVADILTSGGRHPERTTMGPPSFAMLNDARVLATRVTQLLTSYASTQPVDALEPEVISGYRPPMINAMVPHAARNSNHIVCRAVDIADPRGDLAKWCTENIDLLEHHELWMESPKYTEGWVHLQSSPPHSNHRIFVP